MFYPPECGWSIGHFYISHIRRFLPGSVNMTNRFNNFPAPEMCIGGRRKNGPYHGIHFSCRCRLTFRQFIFLFVTPLPSPHSPYFFSPTLLFIPPPKKSYKNFRRKIFIDKILLQTHPNTQRSMCSKKTFTRKGWSGIIEMHCNSSSPNHSHINSIST